MFNKITQVMLPVLTVSFQLAVSLKYPQWGLLINLASQPFWIYTSWKAYKEAGQIGLLITTFLVTAITIGGIVNYWLH